MARLKMAATRAYYDGATVGRRGSSIRRSGASASVITAAQLPKLRSATRDLVRNNAHARRAVEAIVSNTIGDGINPQFTIDGERAEELHNLANRSLYSTECDADGVLTYPGLQALVAQTVAESGEAIIRRRFRRTTDKLAVPVQFQVLEGDYLDDSRDGPTPSGGRIIEGVEYDALGRRRAYWLFRDHPGGRQFRSDARPVPAREIAHVYRVERPGQVRGIPWGAPVILTHADFADYEEAHLMRQKIAACFAMFYTEPFEGTGIPGSAREEEDGTIVDSLEPGMIERLPPGAEITFGDPPGVDGYGDFANVSLHKMAMGWGVSYESMTGDLRGVNFSSGKMGRLEFQRNIDRWRGTTFIPQMCDPMMSWWLEAVALTGIDVSGVKVRHVAPRNEMVDPTKELKAEAEAIRAGQLTLSQSVRRSGRDPREHFEEYAADMRMLDELGVVVSTDVRRSTSSPPGGDGDGEED